MYAGIRPDELTDTHTPPRNAKGPFVISGNNRSVWYGSHAFLGWRCVGRLSTSRSMINLSSSASFICLCTAFQTLNQIKRYIAAFINNVLRMFSSTPWALSKMSWVKFTSKCWSGNGLLWFAEPSHQWLKLASKVVVISVQSLTSSLGTDAEKKVVKAVGLIMNENDPLPVSCCFVGLRQLSSLCKYERHRTGVHVT